MREFSRLQTPVPVRDRGGVVHVAVAIDEGFFWSTSLFACGDAVTTAYRGLLGKIVDAFRGGTPSGKDVTCLRCAGAPR